MRAICFRSIFQGMFDHGAHPAQFGKSKRVIQICLSYPAHPVIVFPLLKKLAVGRKQFIQRVSPTE